MTQQELATWLRAAIDQLSTEYPQVPWTDATGDNQQQRGGTMELDLYAYLEDLDSRRRTLTPVERERYSAAVVTVCAFSPAAKAAYAKWADSLGDFRTSAAVVLAAAREEDQ